MVDPTLLSTLDKSVLTLTLNRPQKLNAINDVLAAALLEELQAAANSPEVRVIRLRGNGRAFCAGRDISARPTERDLELVQDVAVPSSATPRPVVAAVHGWTVGAGFELTMDADVMVAADDARIKLPEASIGVFVTGGLVATLPAIAGLSRAKAIPKPPFRRAPIVGSNDCLMPVSVSTSAVERGRASQLSVGHTCRWSACDRRGRKLRAASGARSELGVRLV